MRPPYQSADGIARISTTMSSQPGQEAFSFDQVGHLDSEGTAPFAVALLALSMIENLGRKSLIALVKAYGHWSKLTERISGRCGKNPNLESTKF
jgi:hypothetical protein